MYQKSTVISFRLEQSGMPESRKLHLIMRFRDKPGMTPNEKIILLIQLHAPQKRRIQNNIIAVFVHTLVRRLIKIWGCIKINCHVIPAGAKQNAGIS
ncbi:hypothetical protein GF337_07915 [candidate division KSB1 bacterium]|nr:hypothetical protein [candidate division KSB1 bacterium]